MIGMGYMSEILLVNRDDGAGKKYRKLEMDVIEERGVQIEIMEYIYRTSSPSFWLQFKVQKNKTKQNTTSEWWTWNKNWDQMQKGFEC